MSVKIMSMTYEAHFHDIEFTKIVKKKTGEQKEVKVKVLAATAKAVTLALADHANEEGEGAYPGLTTLEDKTELSRHSVVMTLEALKKQGVIFYVGISKYGTNNYTVSKEKLKEMADWEKQKRKKVVKPLPQPSEATSLPLVKPLPQPSEATSPEPSINRPSKPSFKEGASAKPKATDFPELVLFRQVVKHFPNQAQREIVISAIQKTSARLGRSVTVDDLMPYWTAWCKVSGNDWSLVWLDEWAVKGTTSKNGKAASTEPKAFDGVRKFLAKHQGVSNG